MPNETAQQERKSDEVTRKPKKMSREEAAKYGFLLGLPAGILVGLSNIASILSSATSSSNDSRNSDRAYHIMFSMLGDGPILGTLTNRYFVGPAALTVAACTAIGFFSDRLSSYIPGSVQAEVKQDEKQSPTPR